MEESSPSAAAAVRPLRIVAVASFVPSFALSIAHGVLSHKAVPAVGLVPQAVSVATSIALLRSSASANPSGQGAEPDVESIDSAGSNSSAFSVRAFLTHPITVFVHDVILATSLMVVLVFTWTHHGHSASLSMLAAYATLPILTSFFCHLFAAALAVYQGLAIHGLLQWVAWQILPPSCPNCEHHLRPTSLPEIPWFQNIKSLNLGLRFPWRRSDDAPLLAPLLAEDDPERYRDDPEDDQTTPQPEAVEVRPKRTRKTKATPAPSDEASETDQPGDSSMRDD
ncbi:hypothetical protein BBK36DRAFT_1157066 [Trichoderma citrinoviride]|uniref:Uncharacterized protein n=1 Tax=Trichoderma citrinoviride TaxID=58853 RepID=A0A2T4BHN5_9HYPO|nr:hypothetical protein BBK36DRAFT_1157066 [Trichoderma citrinoviride]PTB68822.1 hypothetical protein BBK36DRAFT_1157066 [Trichoderma citrinoviride]